MNTPNGMDVNAVEYHTDVRAVAVALIDAARGLIILPEGTMRGDRFNYTQGVLWRVESMFKEDEFIHDPVAAINAALLDAAKSDYWYLHEKEYTFAEEVGEEYEFESDAC